MNSDLMQQALHRRKVNGLDITILLGTPEEMGTKPEGGAGELEGEDDNEETLKQSRELDMAPPAGEMGEAQDRKDMALGKIGHHANMTPGEEIINSDDPAQDAALVRTELAKAQLGQNGPKRGLMGKR